MLERPTGFAIHTGQPQALWLAPAESRLHLIARAYNLEWVFLKADPSEVVRQSTILAEASPVAPSKLGFQETTTARRWEIVSGFFLGLAGLQTGNQTPTNWIVTGPCRCRKLSATTYRSFSERSHELGVPSVAPPAYPPVPLLPARHLPAGGPIPNLTRIFTTRDGPSSESGLGPLSLLRNVGGGFGRALVASRRGEFHLGPDRRRKRPSCRPSATSFLR